MIRRLIEAHYFSNRDTPTMEQARFWLREMRTPELLLEVSRAYPQLVQEVAPHRPLLVLFASDESQGEEIEQALRDAEDTEREKDRAYWQPLRAELEALRHQRRTDAH